MWKIMRWDWKNEEKDYGKLGRKLRYLRERKVLKERGWKIEVRKDIGVGYKNWGRGEYYERKK